MGQNTSIEWADHTWNPWSGCHKVSQGCKGCYMFAGKKRWGQNGNVVVRSKTTFSDPLRWKDPARVFTCSWSDWLIEEADVWRPEAYDIIRATPHLEYLILTKRIERAAEHFPADLSNVWLGVSVEDQKNKYRIDLLRETPAAVRFLSLEPLLEDPGELNLTGIHWVIVGGESGPKARPFDVAWARNTIAQCKGARVACFVKQLGANRVSTTPNYPDQWMAAVKDRKGGNPSEWSWDLRVRQFPTPGEN